MADQRDILPMTEDQVRRQIDDLYGETGWGSRTNSHGNMYWGINHRGQGNNASMNRDITGLTFFTKPRMNLSDGNCSAIRTLTPLLTEEPASIQRAVRAYLDPVGHQAKRHGSPLVDPLSAFIPILSNALISLNGFPDPQIETFTSNPGIGKEAFTFVDGIYRIMSPFDVTADFINLQGDPISLLFNIWGIYMAGVRSGELTPFPEMIVEREIDYQTRIYRLVLDHSRTKVQKICATGVAFPTASTVGAAFNMAADRVFQEANHQISVPFRCTGVDYFDPITAMEFNRIVAEFNPAMKVVSDPAMQSAGWDEAQQYNGDKGYQHLQLKRLTAEQVKSFNYRGYPYIDPYTQDLQWWVPVDDFNQYYNERIRS